MERYVRSFSSPDEVIEIETVRSEMITKGGLTVSHDLQQPGWRWSTHIRPLIGTEWCEVHHVGVLIRGRMSFILRDGTAFDAEPISLLDIPPGHDAWVVGDEPAETIAWTGARGFLAPLESLADRVITTIVFTDIVDSTAAAVRLGDRTWGDLLAAFEGQAADIVARFRGRVVKTTGDGTLATFDGAARALRCALALRDAATGLEVTIRLAVHTGEVEPAGDDIRGLAIHEASRMLSIAGPGEILVSATTATLAGDDRLGLEDRGEHELRGLPGPRRLFALPPR
ncbi:MAG TPA: adenylate/guanylate cyclase domain-containing protein [Candidatus Limnocylindrales bacterium]|nr:adenylate/guanylate cyclase domain-containing protein [Candidatus Limnocylindrales bacterium]